MTASQEDNAALLSQCLDFCKSLSSKSLTFSFALTIGDSFSFSLATRGEVALASKAKKNKKTPSALRRNARRRAEFLKKKLETSTGDSTQSEHVSVKETVERVAHEKAFKCEYFQIWKRLEDPRWKSSQESDFNPSNTWSTEAAAGGLSEPLCLPPLGRQQGGVQPQLCRCWREGYNTTFPTLNSTFATFSQYFVQEVWWGTSRLHLLWRSVRALSWLL